MGNNYVMNFLGAIQVHNTNKYDKYPALVLHDYRFIRETSLLAAKVKRDLV